MTLTPVDHSLSSIETLDPARREEAVTLYLSYARDQLAVAVRMSGPEAVAAIKAEIATAAEATKQLGLSKEIQCDAQEMVRRAEFALGKAIRAGQENGTVLRPGQKNTKFDRHSGQHVVNQRTKMPVTEFATYDELKGNGAGIYDLADAVSETEFETALSDAKAEGNLSRANVVRKIKGVKTEGTSPLERLVKIRDLAPTGMTSGQIAKELGITENRVRDVARENNIRIEADEVMRGTRRMKIDSQHIANHAVMTLEVLASGIAQINYDDLDAALLDDWATSLSKSLSALKRFATHIKEMAQ